jgi:hypothetical protein
VANTTLKEPRVGKNIPTIAKMSQGEVIKFAGDAAEKMRMDGFNVRMPAIACTSLHHLSQPFRPLMVCIPSLDINTS